MTVNLEDTMSQEEEKRILLGICVNLDKERRFLLESSS